MNYDKNNLFNCLSTLRKKNYLKPFQATLKLKSANSIVYGSMFINLVYLILGICHGQ